MCYFKILGNFMGSGIETDLRDSRHRHWGWCCDIADDVVARVMLASRKGAGSSPGGFTSDPLPCHAAGEVAEGGSRATVA